MARAVAAPAPLLRAPERVEAPPDSSCSSYDSAKPVAMMVTCSSPSYLGEVGYGTSGFEWLGKRVRV